jgi:hypothetical protein
MNKIKEMILQYLEYKLELRGNKSYDNDSLDISEFKVKEIPENLSIGGKLYIKDTQIKEIPENLIIM